MQTPLNVPGPAPWQVLPNCATLVFPIRAWIGGHSVRNMATFLCRAPRGRLVQLSYLNTQHGNALHEFSLLPENTSEADAASLAYQVFVRQAAEHGVEDLREIAPHHDSPLVRRHLSSAWFVQNWNNWAKRDSEIMLLSCVDYKDAAGMAAMAVAPFLRQTDISPCGWVLADCMTRGVISADDRVIPMLAYFLGLIFDSHSDGACEAVRVLRQDAGPAYECLDTLVLARYLTKSSEDGRNLAPTLARFLMKLPSDLLRPHQARLDQFLWSNPTEKELQEQCHTEDVFLGPLPVRMSLGQVLCELLTEETLFGILNWAHDRPLLAAA